MRELQGFVSRCQTDYISQFTCQDFIMEWFVYIGLLNLMLDNSRNIENILCNFYDVLMLYIIFLSIVNIYSCLDFQEIESLMDLK